MDISQEHRRYSDDRPPADARRGVEPVCEPPIAGEGSASLEPRQLLDDALNWIVRLKSGEATEADLEALRRWRDRSARHDEAFRDAARLWRRVGVAARELAAERRAERWAAARERWTWRSAVSSLRTTFETLSADARPGKRRR
ncbi:DUF4880 domain-containing protein [Methylosinus sp. Sm6]|uniref:FecR/PupR family sigma factor regulator n=1 Tax=Methylosinus sp. Sm6 TaxID=2866948 RepID=UPI001C99390A|nr:DUF4880 domain-containing protein [Methylosinus sp. Sm6]MBY6239900.1 DUF4880 domain-containing protein [Methylosinus sp. Sm6]